MEPSDYGIGVDGINRSSVKARECMLVCVLVGGPAYLLTPKPPSCCGGPAHIPEIAPSLHIISLGVEMPISFSTWIKHFLSSFCSGITITYINVKGIIPGHEGS